MSSTIPILAVAGRPVLHSMSPRLFRGFFRASGDEAAYTRVAAESAAEAIGIFRALGMRGMNLTAPFKEEAAALVDELTPEARALGAVNCLVPLADGRVLGANTDGQGVVGALRGRGVEVSGKRCLVIGSGGAGKAAARALAQAGGALVILNRTEARARALASELGCEAGGLDELSIRANDASVIVSTLASEVLPDPETWLPRPGRAGGAPGTAGVAVLDADYKTATLARRARARGFVVAGGLEWLACQALPAYELFMGRAAGIPAADTSAADEVSPVELAGGSGDLGSKSRRIALVGLMGAGKTATGATLAKLLSRPFVDADGEIVREAGKSVAEIFAGEGESGFRARELRCLDRITSFPEPVVLATGGGAPVSEDGGRTLRERCLGVWLHVLPETALARASGHGLGVRPLLADGDPAAKLTSLESERRGAYALCSELVVSTESRDASTVARMIRDEIDRLS